MAHSALAWILRHRRLVQALFLLAGLALLPGLARLGTDNSPGVFYLQGSPEVVRYRELRRLFGSDEVVRIAAAGPGLWTAAGLSWLSEIETRAASLAGVEGVSGLATRHRLTFPAWPPADPEAFRRLALADTLSRQIGWIDARGEAATVVVVLRPGPPPATAATLDAVRGLAASPPTGVEARLVGLAVIDEALDGSSREIQTRFFPLLAAFTLVLLALAFRDLLSVLVPLAFVLAGELFLLGPMGFLGVKLNLVLAVLPPLTFVLGLATAVHLLVRYREGLAAGLDPVAAVLATYRDKGWAVLWTGITTLVGFGSLVTSDVGPVSALGLWSSVGIALQTVLAFTLYPALLASWVGSHFKGERRIEPRSRAAGRRWAEGSAKNRAPLLAATALASLLAAIGLPRLAVESNALTYLPVDHPARAAISDLEARGIGPAAVELVVHQGAGLPSLRAPEGLGELQALAARLREVPDVLGAVGGGDVAAAVQASISGVASGFGGLAAAAALERALAPFITPDGTTARLTLFVPTTGFERLDPVIAAAKERAAALFPHATIETTGQQPLLLETQRHLLRTLASSFSMTLVCVSLILGFLVGSFRLMLLALVPNVWPVLGTLGAMGWLGIPLDVATVMVASVILGIAVDDTIHTLGHFRELAPELGRREAVIRTLEHTAGAYVLTGVMLIAGFGVCAFSSFAPTARFGLLTALGIALALIGDLFLVPALLGGQAPKRERS